MLGGGPATVFRGSHRVRAVVSVPGPEGAQWVVGTLDQDEATPPGLLSLTS